MKPATTASSGVASVVKAYLPTGDSGATHEKDSASKSRVMNENLKRLAVGLRV